MQLLTKSLEKKLPRLYSQEKNRDPFVHAKFFTPSSSWTWFVTEGQKQGEDYLFFGFFFGYVIGLEEEWGYFCLSELRSIRGPFGLGVERDKYFTPGPFSEVLKRFKGERGTN